MYKTYGILLTKQAAVQTHGIIDTLVYLLEVSQFMAPGWVRVHAGGPPGDIKPISALYVQTTALESLRMMCNASCLELEVALSAHKAVVVSLRASYLLLLMLAWQSAFFMCCSSFGLLECIQVLSPYCTISATPATHFEGCHAAPPYKLCSVLKPTRLPGEFPSEVSEQ